MVTAVVAAPLLLATATIDLDRIGARCLVFFAGASLLLAARCYRHTRRVALLRVGGLWPAGCGWSLPGRRRLADRRLVGAGAWCCCSASSCLAAAVATGRGWRSVWWSRRAELAEGLCGSFALRRDGRRVRLVPQPVGNHVLRFRP